MSIAHLRDEYLHGTLSEHEVDRDPIRQFDRWMNEAQAAQVVQPTAMTLATATADGVPSARMVLLKGFDAHGFVFYTDYRSQKGNELAHNPRAALVSFWAELERQVRVTGRVTKVTHEESAAYFNSRPLGSRLSATASHQSSVIDGRAALDSRVVELAHRYDTGNPPPLPEHWGGYRVRPDTVEFWQGRQSRLHDRLLYTRDGDGIWRIERLSP